MLQKGIELLKALYFFFAFCYNVQGLKEYRLHTMLLFHFVYVYLVFIYTCYIKLLYSVLKREKLWKILLLTAAKSCLVRLI